MQMIKIKNFIVNFNSLVGFRRDNANDFKVIFGSIEIPLTQTEARKLYTEFFGKDEL